jgi:hypothetical protein
LLKDAETDQLSLLRTEELDSMLTGLGVLDKDVSTISTHLTLLKSAERMLSKEEDQESQSTSQEKLVWLISGLLRLLDARIFGNKESETRELIELFSRLELLTLVMET